MKIAFDHQIFTWQKYGGISRYFSSLANSLFHLDQDPHIFAGAHQNYYLKNLSTSLVTGINCSNFYYGSQYFFNLLNHYYLNHEINQWKPDIIHETYYSSFKHYSKKAARITTVYDMIYELFPQYFSKFDRFAHYKKNTLDRVDHIICISNNTKKNLIDILNIDKRKISVVHLGIDIKMFSTKAIKQDFISQKPYILYVGNRSGYKNFAMLLKAFSSSKNIKEDFNLIAFGGGKFTREEILLMNSLGLDDNKIKNYEGDDSLLASFYKNARALIFPSVYEGFGLPPLEAMAADCPVISSNSSSMPEVIGDAAVYFNPLSLDSMIDSIENVLYSEEIISNLKLKGKNRVKTYSELRTAKLTLDIYKRIV